MVRHVRTRERASGAQVGMHRKQDLAKMRRRFEEREEVDQEMRWVGEGGVTFLVVAAAGVVVSISRSIGGRLVIEDDDFVDAEDGEGAGDGAGEVGLLVMGFGVGDDAAGEGDGEGAGAGFCGCEDGGGFGCVEVRG